MGPAGGGVPPPPPLLLLLLPPQAAVASNTMDIARNRRTPKGRCRSTLNGFIVSLKGEPIGLPEPGVEIG